MGHNSWVEVSKSALIHNLRAFKKELSPGTGLMHVVKANAYGHGLLETLSISESSAGLADTYGVHAIEDAVAIRRSGVTKDIYVLGYVNFSRLRDIALFGLIPVVTNIETIHRLSEIASQTGKEIRITVKCETGTNRQGILEEDVSLFAEKIRQSPLLSLDGLSTHFANIEDTSDHTYAQYQMSRFSKFIDLFKEHGLSPKVNHIACSAAILLFSETHHEMVRAGIASYGLWPSKSTYVSKMSHGSSDFSLRPVLSWKTVIGQIKDVKAGESVGYGCSYKAASDSRLAILPVGYYDGYDRKLSNISHVLINGSRAPLRGRVCMNMIIVDVTHIKDASLEDEVVLLGSSGNESVSADTLAEMTGTINYEIVSRINPLIPRIVTD